MFLLVGPTNQFSFTWKGPEALRSRRSGHLSKVPTFPQKSPFPPSLRGLLPKKERKKERKTTVHFRQKEEKEKEKKDSLSPLSSLSLSLYLSWEGKERVHAAPGLGFRHIINTWISKSSWIWVIILLFIYLFFFAQMTFIYFIYYVFCSNDFFSFSSIMSASLRIKFLSWCRYLF